LFNATYGIQFPGGDMADRFGTSFDLGGGFEYMSPSELDRRFGNSISISDRK
jgi:hypothetical protein